MGDYDALHMCGDMKGYAPINFGCDMASGSPA